jgi:TfoX/Sxy family transcriptional regulator of competence genes
MPYNEVLAQRIRAELGQFSGLVEKKMFGGIAFLVNGNMACGVHKEDLVVRVGPASYEKALAQAYTRPFDMTGRPMAGWVEVESAGYAVDGDLKEWIRQGMAFALTLLPK